MTKEDFPYNKPQIQCLKHMSELKVTQSQVELWQNDSKVTDDNLEILITLLEAINYSEKVKAPMTETLAESQFEGLKNQLEGLHKLIEKLNYVEPPQESREVSDFRRKHREEIKDQEQKFNRRDIAIASFENDYQCGVARQDSINPQNAGRKNSVWAPEIIQILADQIKHTLNNKPYPQKGSSVFEKYKDQVKEMILQNTNEYYEHAKLEFEEKIQDQGLKIKLKFIAFSRCQVQIVNEQDQRLIADCNWVLEQDYPIYNSFNIQRIESVFKADDIEICHDCLAKKEVNQISIQLCQLCVKCVSKFGN